jgi:hypothetical protein
MNMGRGLSNDTHNPAWKNLVRLIMLFHSVCRSYSGVIGIIKYYAFTRSGTKVQRSINIDMEGLCSLAMHMYVKSLHKIRDKHYHHVILPLQNSGVSKKSFGISLDMFTELDVGEGEEFTSEGVQNVSSRSL